MNNLEKRLGAAYREAADTVRPEEIRSLHAQIEQPARRRTRGSPRPGRSLGPMMAATAVLAVAVTVGVVVPNALSAHFRSHHAAARGHANRPGQGATAPASLPAFAVTQNGSGLAILDTTTWKTVAQVPAPRGRVFTAVAGAADDRTFVLSADLSAQSTCDTWLYQLHLNNRGQPTGISLLVPKMSGLPTSVAVSADAGTVAYSVVQCASGPTGHIGGSQPIGDIGVINVATKKVRQWSFTLNEDYTNDLSLSANGSLLGFSSYLDGVGASAVPVGRVLSANAQPGTVQQRDRILVQPAQTKYAGVDAVALSTDGHTMYACTHSGSSATDITELLAGYDTATGQQTRVLRTWHPQDLSCGITADPTGGFLLVSTTSGSRNAGSGRAASSRAPKARVAILHSGSHQTIALAWIDLATGSFTTLPVKLPIGSDLAL